ncbi:MAG: glutamine amidotransferase [Nitrososphaeria archaeon]|nr:glutamine amidotransferase [Nitrososphaeria archaeon]
MLLLVDNGSVFTENIVKFLLSNKTEHALTTFDRVNLDDLSTFDSVILSGRRHNDQTMNVLNSKIVKSNPLCSGIIQVYQSHSYEISRLGKSLLQLGSSSSCKNEIIQYQNEKIFGTQFHPEMTNDGLSLIEKFINL